jgi:hypothetical protein
VPSPSVRSPNIRFCPIKVVMATKESGGSIPLAPRFSEVVPRHRIDTLTVSTVFFLKPLKRL